MHDGSDGDPTVIAYDPGGVTGWALFSVHPDAVADPSLKILNNVEYARWGQFTGTEFDQVDQMLDLADAWPGAAIVTEDFILRQFNASRALLSPVRLNAAFRYCLGRDRRVYLQQPSLAKTTITDERLRVMGYWDNTKGEVHARDAIRHNFTFWKRVKEDRKLLAAAFPALLGA